MLDVLNKLIDKFICKKYDLKFSIEISDKHHRSPIAYELRWEVNSFVINLLFDANSLWCQNVEDDLNIIIKSTGGDIAWRRRKYVENYSKYLITMHTTYYIK